MWVINDTQRRCRFSLPYIYNTTYLQHERVLACFYLDVFKIGDIAGGKDVGEGVIDNLKRRLGLDETVLGIDRLRRQLAQQVTLRCHSRA